MYTVGIKATQDNRERIKAMIRSLGGAIVMKHALGMATALYQVYPVGPESGHKDGSPHTRDTFAITVSEGSTPPSIENAVASQGQFSNPTKKFEFKQGTKLSFIAAGACFFLEWGTIYIEPRVIIRPQIKLARQKITNELRQLNIRL